ncbi:MAG: rod shape-determining protein MreD, partial [candidate division Zixibacteria bacterium RBG_16_40_9]
MFFENIFYSRIINFLILFFFLLFYQTLIADWITLQGARLDLGIFVLVYLALNYSPTETVIFGFIWGLLQDVFHPSLLGLGALIKTALGFGLANFKSQ